MKKGKVFGCCLAVLIIILFTQVLILANGSVGIIDDMYGKRNTPLIAIDDMYSGQNLMIQSTASILASIPSQYTSITFPSTHNATILSAGNSVWYSFVAPSTGRYAIKAMSGSQDTIGWLFDSAGTQLASSNDGRVKPNIKDFHISEVLTGGNRYYVQVKYSSPANQTGSFPVYFYPDDVPDGYYYAPALPVSDAVTQTGIIDYEQDRDVFTFTPSQSGIYLIGSEGADYSTVTTLYNSTMNSLLGSDESGPLQYNLTANTTYYIEVRSSNGIDVGDYELNVLNISGITDVSERTKTNVSITTAGQKRWYRFVPMYSQRYAIKAVSSLDTSGTLYNSAGTQIAYSNDGKILSISNRKDFNISEILNSSEVYYLCVDLKSGTGNFNMYIYDDDFTDGSYYNYMIIPGSDVNGKIDYENDCDVFAFTPPETGSYTFTIINDSTVTANLYISSGQLLSSGEMTSEGNHKIIYSLSGGQTYYIEVKGRSSNVSMKEYELIVSGMPGNATQISIPSTTNVSISSANQTKTYQFVPAQTGRYTMKCVSDGLNTDGTLYDSTGTLIAHSNDGKVCSNLLDSNICEVLTAGETYYITVKLVNSSTGNFQLRIYSDQQPDGAYYAAELTVGESISSQIDYPGDRDMFVFTPTESGEYRFLSSSSISLIGTLRNSTTLNVIQEDAGSNGGNFRVYKQNMVSGTSYYFVVRHSSETGTGEYTIYLQRPMAISFEAI